MAKVKTMTPAEFAALLPKLNDRLTKDLKREQEDGALTDLGKESLWTPPS